MLKNNRWLETRDGLFTFSVDEDLLVRRGVTTQENAEVIALFIECWTALLADSPLQIIKGKHPRRRLRQFLRKLCSAPIRDTILEFALLADKIVKDLSLFGEGTTTGTYEPLMAGTPVFKEYLHWHRTGDPLLLRYLLTFLYFGKRLQYQDPELFQSALRDWRDNEYRIGQVSTPKDGVKILSRIVKCLLARAPKRAYEHAERNDMRALHKDTMYNVFGCTSDQDLQHYREIGGKVALIPWMGRHGPGNSAEGERGSITKTHKVTYHPRLDRGFMQDRALGNKPGVDTLHEFGHDPLLGLPRPTAWLAARRRFERGLDYKSSSDISVLREVPKYVNKARLICMEPLTFMYFQQHLRWELEGRMSSGPLQRFVTIRKQIRNQRLAEYGSCTGRLDTIDMKRASDSVSAPLVKALFPPRLAYKMFACRTSKVQTSEGDVVTVNKFAPMGSAICFPTQTVIFAATVIMAYMLHTCNMDLEKVALITERSCRIESYLRDYIHTDVDHDNIDTDMYETFSVYGDDIICDYRITEGLVTLLESLGFEVNTNKSFTGSQAFRESCGKFYWGGSDVTPMFFRIPNKGVWDAKSYSSITKACNNAGDRGLRNVRRFLINTVKREIDWGPAIPKYKGMNPVAFSSEHNAANCIYSNNVCNNHIETRTHKDWQCIEAFAMIGKPSQKKHRENWQIDSNERFVRQAWWQAAQVRGEECAPYIQLRGKAPRPTWDSLNLTLDRSWIPIR